MKQSQDKVSLLKTKKLIKKQIRRKNLANRGKRSPKTASLAIVKLKEQIVMISRKAINHLSSTKQKNLGKENAIVLVRKLQDLGVKSHLKG